MPEREDELTAVTPAEDFQFRGIADPAGTPVSVRGGAWADLLKTAGDTMTGQLELDHGGGYHLVIGQPFGPVDQRRVTWNLGSSGRLVLRLADDADLTRVVPFAVEPDGKSTFADSVTVEGSDPEAWTGAGLTVLNKAAASGDQGLRILAAENGVVWFRRADDAGTGTGPVAFYIDTAGKVVFSGDLTISKDDSASLDLDIANGPADARRFRLWAGSADGLWILASDDAGGVTQAFVRFRRSDGVATFFGPVAVPDATAGGQALAYGQSGASVAGLTVTSSPVGVTVLNGNVTSDRTSDGATAQLHAKSSSASQVLLDGDVTRRLYFRRADGTVRQMLISDETRLIWYAGNFVNPVITIENADGAVSLASAPSVQVPAAADGDTTTAAQTTAFDSTTGRVAVNGVEIGDTGWRDVSAGLTTGWTADAGYPRVRRVGNVVHVGVRNLEYSSGGGANYNVLPAGFRPSFTHQVLATNSAGASSAPIVSQQAITTSGNMSASTAVSVAYLSTSYTTDEPWPATLPGTPA